MTIFFFDSHTKSPSRAKSSDVCEIVDYFTKPPVQRFCLPLLEDKPITQTVSIFLFELITCSLSRQALPALKVSVWKPVKSPSLFVQTCQTSILSVWFFFFLLHYLLWPFVNVCVSGRGCSLPMSHSGPFTAFVPLLKTPLTVGSLFFLSVFVCLSVSILLFNIFISWFSLFVCVFFFQYSWAQNVAAAEI